MAMMQAGVPIKAPVAGIAMGLIHEGDKYQVLSDILGDEDHLGDMDFKVCGTKEGITALQMDIKISGLPREVLAKALHQAKEGRLHILEKMNATISGADELSDNAPRIFTVKVDPAKVRDVIGPGGKNIKRITSECGVKLDIGDNGMIKIVAPSIAEAEEAKKAIREIVTEPEVGKVYLGTVIKVMDFGAFVEIKPGTEGLVHISQLDDSRVEKVEDVAKEGDEMMVKLIEVDKLGRLKLSRKEALSQGKPN
jgi:polyribonucleotide nucleotidyltransferase